MSGGGRVRKRERGGEKKILISLQTRGEIKVSKTYPSKGCRVSCKMEIFPKLTDPIGCRRSRGGEHMQTGRGAPSAEVHDAGAQRRVCINICAYVSTLRGELAFRHASFTLERHFSGPSNYFFIILDAQKNMYKQLKPDRQKNVQCHLEKSLMPMKVLEMCLSKLVLYLHNIQKYARLAAILCCFNNK